MVAILLFTETKSLNYTEMKLKTLKPKSKNDDRENAGPIFLMSLQYHTRKFWTDWLTEYKRNLMVSCRMLSWIVHGWFADIDRAFLLYSELNSTRM